MGTVVRGVVWRLLPSDAVLPLDELGFQASVRAVPSTKTHLVSKPWVFMFLQSFVARATHPYSGVNKVVFWGVLGGGEIQIFFECRSAKTRICFLGCLGYRSLYFLSSDRLASSLAA